MEMLRNFLFEIAGCTSNFTVQNRQQVCINEIREKVDKSKVLVSGKTSKLCHCVVTAKNNKKENAECGTFYLNIVDYLTKSLKLLTKL